MLVYGKYECFLSWRCLCLVCILWQFSMLHFNMLVRNASPRGPMCFRCLMLNLSGPCELLFFTLFYCLLDLSCSECDVISLYFFVALLMDLLVLCIAYLTVYVNCLVKQFAMYLGMVAILLVNVIDAHIECYSDCSHRNSHLFNVCSAVTVE